MVRHRPSLRGMAAAVAALAVLVLLAGGLKPAYTDDIDLLRFTTAKPYVYFIVDNSASMNMAPDGSWVHANGDDPRSKMYQVKQVLYEVFKDVNDIQFGFASFNQDALRVKSKHWLYYYVSSTSNKLPNDWPINYPAADNDGPVITAANGTVTSDIEGDLMTFGAHLDATGEGGTCLSPLTFGNVGADDRETINRYAKLGALGASSTRIWIEGGAGNKTYRLTVERPSKKVDDVTPNPALGADSMDVRLTLEELKNNACPGDSADDFAKTYTTRLELTLWTDFLMNDDLNGRKLGLDDPKGGVDELAGFWPARDVLDSTTCNSSHPHTGLGWEGNYDTTAEGPGFPEDPFCAGGDCTTLKRPTVAEPNSDIGKALDRGDMLPFDWRTDQKTEFLKRFVPNHELAAPDFRIASYFKKEADASTGLLPLNDPSQIPMIAAGPTPLGAATIDFRCWYLDDSNKCGDDLYNPGFESRAAKYDSEWGCRRPYLIVLSDGGMSCQGPNPCNDTADLKNKGGVQTWVIAYGADCSKTQNPLKCMPSVSNNDSPGKLPLCPQNSTQLKTELLKILGLIRQEARSFASAAVPSVQAIVEDKIFLTNFTPLNGAAVWDGHVHSFLKPLPLRSFDSRPDTEHANHLWDAGEVMVATQVNAGDPTGPNPGQRRVYYARENTGSGVPAARRLFEKTENADGDALRYDLWRGLTIPFTADSDPTPDSASEIAAQNAANALIEETFKPNTAKVDVKNEDGTTTEQEIEYILGDIFHSNPLVIGDPPSVKYYAADLNGYQDFAAKHRLRRKLLLVGANDGMLHAFDAGKYSSADDVFDNGTGKEVFAYIPRRVLPTMKLIHNPSATIHQWSVDGTMTVADVHIDPLHDGTPTPADREWRTMGVAGLREGGAMVYALDITQPDVLTPGDDPGEDFVPQPANGYVPSCNGESGFNASDCGPVPFPSVLWEFDDSVVVSGATVMLDEESDVDDVDGDGDKNEIVGNGKSDLGETWSTPNVGRIRVAVANGSKTTQDVYVAVFGGGLDPANKTKPQQGTWIYMVDIETGKAIYKRQLLGAMPSEPSAVDTDGDGYLDRIYAGTTAGRIYRIDLTADILGDVSKPEDDLFPALETEFARRIDGAPHAVKRIPATSWKPHIIFNASTNNGVATLVERPIYFRPSVVYDAKFGAYMLAFGTGDREDLWNLDLEAGRFVVFLDDTDGLTKDANGDLVGGPLDESDFKPIAVTTTAPGENIETLAPGKRGWFILLDANERVINDAFALSGVTFFSTFKPQVEVTETQEGPQCSKKGVSRIFIVSTLTANPFVQPPEGTSQPVSRAFEVPHFVTNPFAEPRATGNSDAGGVPEICDDPTKNAIMESLKTLFPVNCKFGNFMVDIKTIAADTSLVCIAPVPVCLIEANWKEW
jgi:hypothetical protein